jgi:hypothetical protein
MSWPAVFVEACVLFGISLTWADAASSVTAEVGGEVVKVSITKAELSIAEKNVSLAYEIRNESQNDIWICDNMSVGQDARFEAYIPACDDAVRIRRRSAIGLEDRVVMRSAPLSRYVRLGSGQSRRELLLLPLPFRPQTVWASDLMPLTVAHATGLILEIGYYDTDLSATVPTIGVGNAEGRRTHEEFFAYEHELPPSGERTLHLVVDGLQIPCDARQQEPPCPDSSQCTRMEISWYPSVLEYFFPHADQKLLLSANEIKHLSLETTTTISDDAAIKAITRDIGRGVSIGITVTKNKAHVVCLRDGEPLTSFDMYDSAVITQHGEPLAYGGFYRTGFPSLREFVPHVRGIELRVQCANNLDDLYGRLRYYVRDKAAYPVSSEWSDEIVRQYQGWITGPFIAAPFRCPSAGVGKCHYAANPNCRPDSPGDTVLLFETKGGWNQRGGPELFTFDNHDPKGGCVLLNDGTVRFIRTKEELHALRWK